MRSAFAGYAVVPTGGETGRVDVATKRVIGMSLTPFRERRIEGGRT